MFSVLITYFAHVITTFLNMPKRYFSDFEDKDKVNAWSDKNKLKAHEVSLFSHKKAIFKCYNQDCSREFEIEIHNVTGKSNKWCPCCKGNTFCGKETCKSCLKKSFASFEDKNKVNAFSKKNKFKPHEVKISSQKKATFECYNEECGREFELIINRITSVVQWCPCCDGNKLCGEETCIPCRKKSFAFFEDKNKVNAFSNKNNFKPHEVAFSSKKYAIFECYKCPREFKKKIYTITKQGLWCPVCNALKNKFIKKLFDFFYGEGMKPEMEVQVECEGRTLRWDMVVSKDERKFYIESDGEHHFSVNGLIGVYRNKVSNEEAGIKFQDQRARDLLKEKHIVDNDKLLFRISYRQFDKLEELVKEMISKSNEGYKGVVKMDTIYNW